MPNHEKILSNIIFGMQRCGKIIPISHETYNKIIEKYKSLCADFIILNRIEKLDTYQKAGCLLFAINESKLVDDKTLNADIALTAALHMCSESEENIDIELLISQEHFKDVKKMIIEALTTGYLSTFSCYLNLKTICESNIEQKNQKTHHFKLKESHN